MTVENANSFNQIASTQTHFVYFHEWEIRRSKENRFESIEMTWKQIRIDKLERDYIRKIEKNEQQQKKTTHTHTLIIRQLNFFQTNRYLARQKALNFFQCIAVLQDNIERYFIVLFLHLLLQ